MARQTPPHPLGIQTPPFELGDECTVVYLHRAAITQSTGTVTAVRQRPHSNTWTITARAHATGIAVEAEVDHDGYGQFIAPGRTTPAILRTPAPPRGRTKPGTPAVQAQIMVSVRGNQSPTVTAHSHQPANGHPAVLVSFAGIMTVCHGPAATGRRARAWSDAVRISAGGHLPHVDASTRLDDSRPCTVGLASVEDVEPVKVIGHGRGNSLDGDADVIVRIGELSVRCLDLESVVSLAAAWADADRLGRVLWGTEAIAHRPQL